MRTTSVILAVVAVALGLSASVEAANTPTSGGGATVTKATLPSGYSDSTGFYPATCDETQVVNENQRKETSSHSWTPSASIGYGSSRHSLRHVVSEKWQGGQNRGVR